jgi:hypothetical protein
MKQRLSLGVLTTGLGAAALIGFGAGPALADHTDGSAVVRQQQQPPDPQKLAALLPKLQELSANPKVKQLTAELQSVPAVADLKKAQPSELAHLLEVAAADAKVGKILNKLESIPEVKAFLIAGFSGATTTQSDATTPSQPAAVAPEAPGIPEVNANAVAQVNAVPANAANAADAAAPAAPSATAGQQK